ncbi:MAG: YfhO family protein [Coleofasciculaceae cyanobacterium]
MNLIKNFRKTSQLNSPLFHTFSIFLFFSILFTIFFAPVIFSERLLAPGDGITYYVPAFYSHRTLWTDLILSGFPVAADPQVETWYPISLILSLIPNSWNAFVVSAYVLASCFTYGYVYSLTNSRLAGLISGIVYSMSGFMMAHLGHTTIIHAAAWMPLLIWTADRLSDRLSAWWFVIGTGAVACTILAGHPQISLYGIGLSAAYAFLLGWTTPVGRWKYYGTFLAVIILGVFLAAIQIVPTAELSGLSLRAKMTFQDFASHSLPPDQITQLIFPYLFGGGGPFLPDSQPPYFGGWNLTEVTGYIGLLPPLLAVIGFLVHRDKPIARFWLVVAVLTLLLSLGSGTPLARLLYYLPAYNKFRAQGRHFIEMALAVSVLAGFGVSAMQKQLVPKPLVWKTVLVSTLIVILNLVSIFVFSNKIQQKAIAADVGITEPLSFFPWTNPAVGVPLVIFFLVVTVLIYFYRSLKKPSRLSVFLLLIILVIDLGSFGRFYAWEAAAPNQDVLTPTAVMSRYRKLLNENKQRIFATRGGIGNFDEIPPNISRIWGIPNASGYGPLILSRYSELLSVEGGGDISSGWDDLNDQSLDITAVRYVSVPLPELPVDTANVTSNKGILWAADDLTLAMGVTCGVETQPQSVKLKLSSQPKATAIAIVSSLGCSTKLLNNAEVLQVSVKDTTGKVVTKSLLAGKNTSEWAYDCSDVLPQMQHNKAPIFSSLLHQRQGYPDCQIHKYLSVLPLGQINNVEEIDLKWVGSSASINIQKISLFDEQTKQSYPVNNSHISRNYTTRWQQVEDIQQTRPFFFGARIYENLRAMPRVWLVPEVVSAKKDQVLNAIKSSKLPDERSFEPSQVALIEKPLNFKVEKLDPAATAKIINLADTQLEIKTSSSSPAFMVLSDIYYPGWEAKIDGKPTKIFQTNYALRGVQIPAGEHTIKFEFKPVSFHIGAGISAASLFLLGYLAWKLQKDQKIILTNE